MKLGLNGVVDSITFLKNKYSGIIGLDGKRISTSFITTTIF